MNATDTDTTKTLTLKTLEGVTNTVINVDEEGDILAHVKIFKLIMRCVVSCHELQHTKSESEVFHFQAKTYARILIRKSLSHDIIHETHMSFVEVVRDYCQ